MVKRMSSHYKLQFKRFRWDRKWRATWDQQVIKAEALGVQGRFFRDFDGYWQAFCFFYVRPKGGPKSRNNQLLGGTMGPPKLTLDAIKLTSDAIYHPGGPLMLADSG